MACVESIELRLLPDETIITCIREYTGLIFTLNDLKNPTYEKLYPVISAFICNNLGVSNEQLSQPPLHLLESIQHPELQIADGVGKVLLIKIIGYFFSSACQVPDFTLSDLTMPNRKRTKKLLSALVNYIHFVASRAHVEAEIKEKVEKMQSEREIFTARLEANRAKLASLKAAKVQKQKDVYDMNLSALRAKKEKIIMRHIDKEQHNQRLKSELDEIQNLLTVSHASKLIKQGNEALQDHVTRARDLAVKEKVLSEFNECVPSALKLMQGIERDVNRRRIASNENENAHDQVREQHSHVKELSVEIQNISRQIKGKQELNSTMAAYHDKRMQSCIDDEAAAERAQAQFFAELEGKHQHLEVLKSERRVTAETKLAKTKEYKENIDQMNAKRDELLEKVEIFHTRLIERQSIVLKQVSDLAKRKQ